MMDVEGGEAMSDDITKDFAYNNNVAGAAKHIRMGEERSKRLDYTD